MRKTLIPLPYLGYSRIELGQAPREGLRFLRLVRYKLGERQRQKQMPPQGYVDHFGVHRPRNNAGDTVLFDVLQKLLRHRFGNLHFRDSLLRTKVMPEDVARINARAQAVLVGGGGLLIEDSNPNAESGWQWRISTQELEAIDVPLILFAIGYNLFRTDATPSRDMVAHVERTLAKSAFFGMRNHGSITRTKELMPAELHEKIAFQPCMTTVLSEYHPLLQGHPGALLGEKRLALNLAFDRAERRFGNQSETVLARIASAVRTLIAEGWRVDVTLHGWDDEPAAEFFRREVIPVNFVYLNLCTPDEIVDYYARVPITVGMRGHAQMIPFGCGNAIFSIISHDKLEFFLDDIRHREWGVDIFDAELGDRIVNFVRSAGQDIARLQSEIAAAKTPLWTQTQANLDNLPLKPMR